MSAVVEVTLEDALRAGKFVGKAPKITNEFYHSVPGLSASKIAKFAKLPMLYHTPHDDKETAAQRLGTLVHMLVLEPEDFAKYVVVVEGNGNSNAVKLEIANAEAAGKYVCRSQAEYQKVIDMALSVSEHPWARLLLTTGEQEISLFERHPLYGFLMKCRPDAIHWDKGIICDLKTYTDLDDRALDKQIKRMKYDLKAVHYLETASLVYGVEFKKFAHIWVSTNGAWNSKKGRMEYPVRVIELGPATMERAAGNLNGVYADFAECLEKDEWPGYPNDIEPFELFI